MRLLALVLVLVTFPALADERDPLADAYYACLVGHGAVEINYGVDAADALEAADKHCDEQAAALEKRPPTGDMGSDVDAVYDAASAALSKLSKV
jgi:hypothetical protein